MMSKLGFVIAVVFMAFFVLVLACLGWVQGYAWHERNNSLS